MDAPVLLNLRLNFGVREYNRRAVSKLSRLQLWDTHKMNRSRRVDLVCVEQSVFLERIAVPRKGQGVIWLRFSARPNTTSNFSMPLNEVFRHSRLIMTAANYRASKMLLHHLESFRIFIKF